MSNTSHLVEPMVPMQDGPPVGPVGPMHDGLTCCSTLLAHSQVLRMLRMDEDDVRELLQESGAKVWTDSNPYLVSHPMVQPHLEEDTIAVDLITAAAFRRLMRLLSWPQHIVEQLKKACVVS